MAKASSGDKGLKGNAIGFVSNVVIGVASTAPGYSLAAVLGFVALEVGFQSPAILWLAFLPMLLIATSYYYLNRDDPDCGTSFTWVSSAIGPRAGWLTGWATLLACLIVMANLAQIAGLYTFLLFDAESLADSTFWVTFVGVVWILVMTLICYIGIELSARIQFGLLTAEVLTLAAFAIVALIKVYGGDLEGSVNPSLDWLNPLSISSASALAAGLILGIFIYWGWDSTVAVNEESENSDETPGRAAITATILLLIIYVIVAIAAQAVHGVGFLGDNSDDVLSALGTDVFSSPWDKILIIAVLSSASASTQTTILPATRSALAMAWQLAIPQMFGRVHPKHQTPHIATWVFGIASIVWYVGLTIVSENILFDSIAALGLMIAFYYGATGFAAAVYYREQLFGKDAGFRVTALAIGGLALAGLGVFIGDVGSEQTNAWTGFFDHASFINLVAFVMAWVGLIGMVVGIVAAFVRAKDRRDVAFVWLTGIVGGGVLAWAFAKSSIDLSDPANSESGDSWFGLGPPLVIGIGGMIVGAILMEIFRFVNRPPAFFNRKRKVASRSLLDRTKSVVAGAAPKDDEELPPDASRKKKS
ncbi:MAG: APC family permease [Solirubrobacterales bacterium]